MSGRSDNLRPAPGFLTPDVVGRVLEQIDQPMVIDAEGIPVIAMAHPKPQLRVVSETSPDEHARRAEEREAADLPHASPPRPQNLAPMWTPEEDEQLRRAYAEGGRVDLLAVELGRTVKAAHTRGKKLGLSHPREIKGGFITHPSWSPEEDALLRELYGNVPTADLPKRIGRSKAAIFTRAGVLGLDPVYRQWTRDEVAALRIAHERGIALMDVAAALGRNRDAVFRYAKRRGLTFGHRRQLDTPISLEQLLSLADADQQVPDWKPGPRRGRYANKLSLYEQPDFQRLAEIAFRRGIAAVDLAHAVGAAIATVLQSNKRLGLAFGRRQPLAEKLTAEQLLSFDDESVPVPELRCDRLARERAAKRNAYKRDRRIQQQQQQTKNRKICEATHPAPRQGAGSAAPREPAPVPKRKALPSQPRTTPQPARAHSVNERKGIDRANKLRADAARRRIISTAEALVDAGKTTSDIASCGLKIAIRTVEIRRQEEARLADPIEQAKTVLRRRFTPVVSMAVYDGDPNLFCVGHRKDVTKGELLALAAKVAP